MEQYGLLDPLNDAHLYVVHYIFIPRINRALSEFQQQHNNHPMRTEHNCTPRQLFEVFHSLSEPELIDPNLYGVEEDGPVPDVDAEDVVIVPAVNVHIAQLEEAAILQIDPLYNDHNYGIELYLQVIAIIS